MSFFIWEFIERFNREKMREAEERRREEARKRLMLRYYEPLPSKPLFPEVKRKGSSNPNESNECERKAKEYADRQIELYEAWVRPLTEEEKRNKWKIHYEHMLDLCRSGF